MKKFYTKKQLKKLSDNKLIDLGNTYKIIGINNSSNHCKGFKKLIIKIILENQIKLYKEEMIKEVNYKLIKLNNRLIYIKNK